MLEFATAGGGQHLSTICQSVPMCQFHASSRFCADCHLPSPKKRAMADFELVCSSRRQTPLAREWTRSKHGCSGFELDQLLTDWKQHVSGAISRSILVPTRHVGVSWLLVSLKQVPPRTISSMRASSDSCCAGRQRFCAIPC